MQPLSDEQLHNLVERVVKQTIGGMLNPVAAPVQAAPETPKPVMQTPPPPAASNKKVIAIGTDHGGVDLKAALKADLIEQGYEVIDCGTNTKDAVDYPDIALAVAQLVASGKAWRGVVIDGAGIGSCMSANKVPGVRAAMCYDISTALNSREHNDANVITLGAGLVGVALAKAILKTWLATEFGGGRHAARVDKIIAIEKSYLKEGK
ncbi:MAG: ribose 5-phosphate isomerase B [Chloroflexi bacterium HGW-Chloroflexi-5]|jgi:ribose 5-phosphate isomerase B|nr:MAG: ribose 5-phosphate isomerase B [Chloroflexi bacterium HGW-Chloroflexi-5]